VPKNSRVDLVRIQFLIISAALEASAFGCWRFIFFLGSEGWQESKPNKAAFVPASKNKDIYL
jgi:hypothetical protein